jgi:hypothetical protein
MPSTRPNVVSVTTFTKPFVSSMLMARPNTENRSLPGKRAAACELVRREASPASGFRKYPPGFRRLEPLGPCYAEA